MVLSTISNSHSNPHVLRPLRSEKYYPFTHVGPGVCGVRVYACSWIPWQYVKMPEPVKDLGYSIATRFYSNLYGQAEHYLHTRNGQPTVDGALYESAFPIRPQIPNAPPVSNNQHLDYLRLREQFDWLIKGDGRLGDVHPDLILTKYRTASFVDVTVDNPRGSSAEFFRYWSDQQPSESHLRRSDGRVVSFRDRGKETSNMWVMRTGSRSVIVKMKVSGSVPPSVAGPQPAIDYEYTIQLSLERELKVAFSGQHDGFPAHQIMVLSKHGLIFSEKYYPTWFYHDLNAKVALPRSYQAVRGGLALGGVTDKVSFYYPARSAFYQ